MECADSRHATLCDADSRGFIVVAFCSAILHHWMCKIPTEVATLTMEEFQKFIDQNPGKTHQQLADLYPVEMSAKTMGVWIKKLGYTRKKRASDTKNVMH
ncbi:hypothetical protein AVI51_12290 [Piscirickettsia salmonis]|nr:hypothetical protein AVI48_04185 [Piscirickettsia salmonis]APS45560.1 hypothetical protein AVI48_15035 [Piscirickettsia salmonis]APS46216.1 hypothetical protein AVI49_00255 [Piscirickettsia salmonis]APS47002.1 hypothetical protein AVI49_04795 [Piscirickettsia salmonis]APS50148.1 hypothetical protein AVI50_04320 [Piscirickettsia salmonis]